MDLSSEKIERYCLSKSTIPSATCQELFEYTQKNVKHAGMLIGPMGAGVLGFLINTVGAKRVLEVGCFTGYSALAMAERLPENGELITLDISEETTSVGKDFWKKSPHGKKIELILGPALQTMKNLKGPFDFVLIDADKENYLAYFKRALELLSPNGIIALDNCLWQGKVVDPKEIDADTTALRDVASYIQSRGELISFLLPIRDGIMIVKKKN
jgi:caffeoyl-CoA O-methyltransferase